MNPTQIWLSLLEEVNQKVKAQLQQVHTEMAASWPENLELLKRPHFEEMHIILQAEFEKGGHHQFFLPKVETIERCFRQVEKKRDKKTRDALAGFARGVNWEKYRKEYWQAQPLKMQLSLSQSQVHMEFQGRIRDLQKNLPHTITDRQFGSRDENVLRFIYLYFFLVFDEYHVCKVISPNELSILWESFYSKGLMHALERELFREELTRIFNEEEDYVFFGLKNAFIAEINRLYIQYFGKEFFKLPADNITQP